MRYFITFTCYGAHLHGDERGSVDPYHNRHGGRLLPCDPKRSSAERQKMREPPLTLDQSSREAVLEALREVCAYRGWSLLAAHVRTNHVHVIVEAELPPEKVMNDLKSYASRRLNRLGGPAKARRRWSRHGSTRWLWKDQDVREAIRYVIEEQGKAMALFVADTV